MNPNIDVLNALLAERDPEGIAREKTMAVRMYDSTGMFTEFQDEPDMATAYADYAQLCGYGVELEVR